MTAAVSSVCGIFTTAITATAIIVIVLAIGGMIFIYSGLDNDIFGKEDVTEWLKIIFRQKNNQSRSW